MNIDQKFAPNACRNTDSLAALVNYENGRHGVPRILLRAAFLGEGNYCEVINFGYPEGPPNNDLPITDGEFETCKSILAARANEVTYGVVWNCFAE